MPCALTSSFTIDCRNAVGGVKRIYITELANKSTLTAAAGVISAFTLTTGKKFWTYDFRTETGEFTEKIQTSVENGTVFYEQEAKIVLNKFEITKRNEILLLAQNQLMIIVQDNNSQYWLMGETNGAYLSPSEAKMGKAMGDMNGYNLVFTGKEAAPMQQVQSSLIATLTVAAV